MKIKKKKICWLAFVWNLIKAINIIIVIFYLIAWRIIESTILKNKEKNIYLAMTPSLIIS